VNAILIWMLVILPIFFALGWIAGRIDMKIVVKQAKQLTGLIYSSIDALVDNKTATASNELQQLVEQEPHNIDTHFALGKLYRKRGENDLAIKLHTNMLNSQFILGSQDLKQKVLLELAKDFQNAGLIDRAESYLLQLVNSKIYAHDAMESLLLIYQQDKNWLEAISIATQLATSDYTFHVEISHFYCELARQQIIHSNYAQALNYLEKVETLNRKCVRASILEGDIYYAQGEYRKAIAAWSKIENQNYLYIPTVLNSLFQAYAHLDLVKQGLNLLKGYAKLYPGLNLYEALYFKMLDYDSPEEILECLHYAMLHRPNARLAALIINFYNHHYFQTYKISDLKIMMNINSYKKDMDSIHNLCLKYHDEHSFYRCGCCGFKVKTFFWQCPACYSWDSISPNPINN
jgi:lipopolysaccharide biosynthesis regulator YciM